MDAPAEFMEFVTQAAEDAVNFDGDEVALASAARSGDKDAVADLTRAYAAIAVLMGVRLRPTWLKVPDAGQEAMLVLLRLIEDGSTTIAADLPSAIEATFTWLRPSDEESDLPGTHGEGSGGTARSCRSWSASEPRCADGRCRSRARSGRTGPRRGWVRTGR
jgi:hypothetical protein